ncbi:MAG: ISL3 family transposase [Chloroflexi bacterium]|nr:ISL3 family transposase [Chloroflexota bacterium]
MIELEADVVRENARCPSCHAICSKVHDRYQRRPVDLPWRGHRVRLVLTVRRFRCPNSACERITFAEDCGPNLPRYARRTLEANDHLLEIAQAAGGEAGARIADGEGLRVSPDTLLRILRNSPLPEVPTPRVLGIDDFALRRRQKYGTIFLDLESRRPVDMVEGREADVVTNWLKAHPGVEVIARDRSGAYAEGARAGAPEATQVADRFHLLQNASSALDGMLRGRRLRVDEIEAATVMHVTTPTVEGPGLDATAKLSPTKQYLADRVTARIARRERVKELSEAGAGISKIAREVGIDRKTVSRLMHAPKPLHDQTVNRRPAGLSSPSLQPYVTYLQDRWQAGCTNASKLYREAVQRGYSGSYTLLARAIRSWRSPRLPPEQQRKVRGRTRRLSMRWICLRPPEQLKPEEKTLLKKLLDQDAELALGHNLLQEFRRVVVERDLAGLENWLAKAKSSNLPTFVALANGIEDDRAAVNAAFSSTWSNGPTEGHINRLKLIKRQGYGRAKFDLLRARVLAA